MRWWRGLVVACVLGLGAASQPPERSAGAQAGHAPETQRPAPAVDSRAAETSQSQRDDGGGSEHLSAYERESLTVDRAANGISERANLIAEAQRSYAFWQMWLTVAGVAFTGVAAFFAYRATHWAKEAARQTKRSADADNAALKATVEAAGEARQEAVEQARRFEDQLHLSADSALAMQASARAATKGLALTTDTTAKQLRPYVYIVGERFKLNSLGIGTVGSEGGFQRIVNDHVGIEFAIKNFGLTPAKRVRLRARAYIGEGWNDGGEVDVSASATLHRGDMPPGFERPIHGYGLDGMAEAYPNVVRGTRSIFFEGKIEYEDSAGEPYETFFRRAATGGDISDGDFLFTEEGNDAT